MKFIVSGLLAITLYNFIYHVPVSANEENNPSETLIETYKEDVTGDSIKETINLYGILFSQDSGYFHNTWATIKGPGKMKWKIPYEGGYEPTLQFYDFDHDGVKDIFYQSATGGSGGLYYYHLHTLENEKLKELPLPESSNVHGEFKENFKAELTIEPGNAPIELNVERRANDYIRLGIYDKEGNLLKQTNLMVDPIAFFEPVLFSKSKGYGLKSYQQVSGAYHADQLGTIEVLWYFENGKWIRLKTQWVPSGVQN